MIAKFENILTRVAHPRSGFGSTGFSCTLVALSGGWDSESSEASPGALINDDPDVNEVDLDI
jgi:hypothetical protein